jgi:hypothetical protein
MAAAPLAAPLILATGSSERFTSCLSAANTKAVDLSAVTAAANHDLFTAACAVEQAVMVLRLDGSSRPSSTLDLASLSPPYCTLQVVLWLDGSDACWGARGSARYARVPRPIALPP